MPIMEYIFEAEYRNITYIKDQLNFTEFENCRFTNCDFRSCAFTDVTFINCIFDDCNLNNTKINHSAFRTVTFNRCTIQEVNFAMCDRLIFEIRFNDCILDFSKFYALKIKNTIFSNCSLIAVDFMNANLTEVLFDNCDLYRSEFAHAIADKADFVTSRNYTIDPEKTKIRKANFSTNGLPGLLVKHDIIVAQ